MALTRPMTVLVTLADDDRWLVRLLRFGAFACLAGWAWQHLYWEGPYGPLFWRGEALDFVAHHGGDWDDFVGQTPGAGAVQRWIAWMAWPYVICAALTITARPRAWLQLSGLAVGGLCLAALAYSKYLAAARELPMLVEHAAQVASPVLLALALACGAKHRAVIAATTGAVIMTFAAHGAYALGWWPTPASFYAMATVVLGTDEATTTAILRSAGALDLLICVGLLAPRLRRGCMLYAATWGLLTALARPVAGMSLDLRFWGADQFLYEAMVRAPHFTLPLYLALIWRRPLARGDQPEPAAA